MDVLYVAIADSDPQVPVRWWVCGESAVTASGTCLLADVEVESKELAKAQARVETIVLLPDREILYIEVEVPGRSQARIRQAAPFAVEPHLTEEIDDVHIALGEVKKSGVVPCMVINRVRFEAYLAVIEEAGIQPAVITTTGMLADPQTDLALIEMGTTVTVRTPNQLAVVAPGGLLVTLPIMFSGVDKLANINCVGSETVLSAVHQVIDQLGVDEVEIESIAFDALLASVKEPLALLNLQQGSFATKDTGVMIRQTLNKTALIAGVCVVVSSAIFFVQGLWAELQSNKLREEALDVYETVYDTREVAGNPVFRMQERLGARVDEQSEWISLLESVVAATSDIEIQNLDFNESQNKMGLTFFADSFQEFESIRSRMENLGMSVEVKVAEQQANRVWVSVTLATP